MKRNLLRISAAVVAVGLMIGCGGGGSSSSTASAAPQFSASDNIAMRGYDAGAVMEDAMPEAEYYDDEPMDMDDEVNMGGGGEGVQTERIASQDRMVITTVFLSMQTMEFDAGVEDIQAIVEEYGGFIQSSYVEGQRMFDTYGTRRADFTARIPSEKLQTFIANMDEKFNVINKQQSGEDITDSYYDSQARLNTLKVQEERLLAMLETAGELEYLLQVERELANVRYEIESLNSALTRMENYVALSTVNLSLEEVVKYTPVDPAPATFGERFLQTVSDSLRSFSLSMQNLLLGIVWLLPFLIVLAILLIIVFVIFRKVRKNRKNRAPKLRRGQNDPPVADAVPVDPDAGAAEVCEDSDRIGD